MAIPAATDTTLSSRDKILDTAEPLFARFGFAGVGLREVADRVGMGKSSLFHHFPSKVQLYVAVMERVFQEFDARLEAEAQGESSPIDQLHAWTSASVRMLAEHPHWAALLLRSIIEGEVITEEDSERIDRLYEQIVNRVSEALQSGIAAGMLRTVSIPHTIQTFIGMTIFHFASGELGEDLVGASVYEPTQVEAQLAHIRDYIEFGLRSSPSAAC